MSVGVVDALLMAIRRRMMSNTCLVAGGCIVSAESSDSSLSSNDTSEPQPQPNKYRCVVVHGHQEGAVDVDAMSSDGYLCIS